MRRMYSKPQLLVAVEEESKLKGIKVFEDIKDKDGHNRFIGDNITIEEITGVEQVFAKWSLSGSHLLIVLFIEFANTTTISGSTRLAYVNVPDWVKEKIQPIYSTFVDTRSFYAFSSGGTTQEFTISLRKYTSPTTLQVIVNNSITLTDNRTLRVTFDLLIDNE